MKLDSIWFCRDADTLNNLQGFVATFIDEVTGQRKSLPYGGVNIGNDSCNGFYVRREVQWMIFKRDTDDIEGVVLGTYEDDQTYVFKTEDIADNDPLDSD